LSAVAVDGFRVLTARPDIDAVLLLGGAWYGHLPILAACEAGKAVYCAAPLQMEPEAARQLKQRVDESGVAFMAEFPRRHMPATLRLKELIATRLGEPRLLFCHRRIPQQVRSPRNHLPTFGDEIRDMLELVDWCRYVVGRDPTSVIGLAHNRQPNSAEEDYRMMSLDFSEPIAKPGSGPIAQISCGYYMPVCWEEAVSFRPPAALQVACENGIAFVDLPSTMIWFDRAGRHQESLESERPVGEQLLAQFHRAVTSLVRNPSGLEDAYRALVIALAARTSHQEGRRVPLIF
jgi:predicted dehydrogenase